MDAFDLAAVGSVDASRVPCDSSVREQSENSLAPRMRTALATLLEALDYARDLAMSPWEFAVELSSLRRSGLSNSDLRWLVFRGLVDHAMEVTLGDDSERSFRHPARLLLGKQTRFVLTAAGAELARKHCVGLVRYARVDGRAAAETSGHAGVHPPVPLLPKWDRDRQELKVGSAVVKQFKIPFGGPEAVLAAFEENNWPVRIDDPLVALGEGSRKPRLPATIEFLNRCQKRPVIRFCEDAGGKGVVWELCRDQVAANGT